MEFARLWLLLHLAKMYIVHFTIFFSPLLGNCCDACGWHLVTFDRWILPMLYDRQNESMPLFARGGASGPVRVTQLAPTQ